MPYVVFDLEIAKEIPDGSRDWLELRPGISCAAIMQEGDAKPAIFFHPRERPDLYDASTHAMNSAGTGALLDELAASVRRGFTIVTWNGVGFDLPLLAAETGRQAECAQLALNSVDMMFQVFCNKGYPLGLDTALAGMGLAGKTHEVKLASGQTGSITGADAPRLWQAGEYDAVMTYCGDDVRRTLALALEVQRQGTLRWLSRRGNAMDMRVGRRWLTVRECAKLPEPDTSWMTDPMTRERYLGWMGNGAVKSG